MTDTLAVTPELIAEIDAKAKAAASPDGLGWESDCNAIFEKARLITVAFSQDDASQSHISRMDPPTMLALVARIRELEAENAGIRRKALEEAVAKLTAMKSSMEVIGTISDMSGLITVYAVCINAVRSLITKEGE